jgi:hypothetical protein
MAVPAISTNFADVLDPLFEDIFFDELEQIADMLPNLYDNVATNGRADMKWSAVGAYDDFTEFTGDVAYDAPFQGYDTTATPIEWVSGTQVERKLFDDDQHQIFTERPRGLAEAGARTRQKHGARIFENAFSVDTLFSTNSEGVALCSGSHTTTSGASTAVGFSNRGTSAMSATAVRAARINMKRFRGDRAERIEVTPNELWYPPELYEKAHEIVMSQQKPGVADNDDNVHRGGYTTWEWTYMGDANNWFMADNVKRRRYLKWTDRVPMEFAMAEDIDTIVAKWRAYMRYAGAIWLNWRWVYGNEVS